MTWRPGTLSQMCILLRALHGICWLVLLFNTCTYPLHVCLQQLISDRRWLASEQLSVVVQAASQCWICPAAAFSGMHIVLTMKGRLPAGAVLLQVTPDASAVTTC